MIASRIPASLAWPASPWKLLEAFQGEVQHLLHPATEGDVRMSTRDGEVNIEIDAPGLHAGAFDIVPAGQRLMVQVRRDEEEEKPLRAILEERDARPRRFELSLPFSTSVEDLDACYDKGILRITARMPEQAKTRVSVRAG